MNYYLNRTALNEAKTGQESIAQDLLQLIETANTPIFGIDTKGRINEWNLKAASITGFTKDEVMGRDLVADFISDDYKTSVKEVLDKALKGEETDNYEFPLYTKSGGRVDILLNSTTRRDASGKIVGVVGVGQDITDRKRAEFLAKEKLEASERQYRSLVDQLPLEIWEEDWSPIRDEIVALHEQGIDLVEYAKNHPEHMKELENRTIAITINAGALTMNKAASAEELETFHIESPEPAYTFVPALQAFLDGRVTVHCEGYQRILNNEVLYQQSTVFIMEGAEEDWSRIITYSSDITESHQINEERIRLTQAVEQLEECVVMFDKDDRIVFCNEAYRKLNKDIIEYTVPGTLFEDHLRAGVRAGVMPEGIGREDEWVAERLAKHRNPTGPFEMTRQCGMTILINEQVLPHGGVVFIISDITESKQAQAQIIQASKLAILGEMATSVAHELNQPLNTIRLAADNSRSMIKMENFDPVYLDQKLESIEGQVIRASAIIDHMRMFGRKAEEKPEKVDPRTVIASAIGLMGEQLRLAGIEILTDFPENCARVSGHAIQMEQVILNLLTNSRDAMADLDEGARIRFRIFEDEAGVHITSQDTGGGIPGDVIDRIFEPFYTTKEIGKGTGLGLSVSYGIIRDMGGTISAKNIDEGARFTITLPAMVGTIQSGQPESDPG